MKVGVLGTGAVGTSLATGFAEAGHEVMFGSRDPAQPRLAGWAAIDPAHRHVGDYRETALFGEFVMIAVPGRALEETLDLAGRDAFSDSIVIDVSNPIVVSDAGVTSAYGDDDSGAEFLQRSLPEVPVVKAFNQIEAVNMTHPERASTKTLRICADDEAAKDTVREVLEGFGWEVRDLGSLSKSRALERGVVGWMRRL